ncbi:MAG TPA: hypothetical protein VIO94_16650, partial [Phenylobacterium sp.]
APQVAQAPSNAPWAAAAHSRIYSLHREYGMTPDDLPATQARSSYVLIGPGDAPADQDDDAEAKAPAKKPAPDARLY